MLCQRLRSARRVRALSLAAFAAMCVLSLLGAIPGAALASAQGPEWTVTAFSEPTNLPPGGKGVYEVEVKNTGDAPTDGSEIAVTDVLPSGLTASSGASGEEFLSGKAMSCTGLTCGYTGAIAPDDSLVLQIPVEAAASAPSSVTNVVSVAGGGAPEASRATPTTISSESAPFGIAPGSTATALSSMQAGAHSDLTSSLTLTSDSQGLPSGAAQETGLDLPPGFVIDVAHAPRCSAADFSTESAEVLKLPCGVDTQIGTVSLRLNLAPAFGFPLIAHAVYPVYNLTTNPGEIARVGFFALEFGVEGTITVRPGDYGGRTTFQNIRTSFLTGVSLTVWGVPADPSHDPMRGLQCGGLGSGPMSCSHSTLTEENLPVSGLPSSAPPTPFFTNMTQCTGEPELGTFFAASWQEPEHQLRVPSSFGTMTGCPLLEFGPYITAAPDTSRADTPAGFSFDVRMPQEGLVSQEGLSSADIENTTATLPAGVAINPGQAAGLAACQFSQDGIGVDGPPTCPSNSKVGEVEVETPLIVRPLKGSVYVLASNPPEIKLLVAPEDPVDGLYVKFIGLVHLNPVTGQLVTTFEKTPELPFSNLRLSFSGGAQAALATPTGCGSYQTTAGFLPWNGASEALTASSFAIESGPGGSACNSPLPFSPELIAGATTDQAGGFTHFSLLLQRADGQQRIRSLQFKVPEGLLGMISKVPLCGEPQASKGECSAASQIGHTVVGAGPGPYPLVVPQPGKPPAPIYLTGGYKGAPYGLSIVVPLEVGPFTLETQVVRAKIEVDSLTAQLTVTTDPLPTIIDGVPADLRSINAVIDRPGFMFNPTSCAPMSFAGTAFSTEGASAAISSHLQVGSCQSLKFKPNFKVSASASDLTRGWREPDAKIVYPTGTLPAQPGEQPVEHRACQSRTTQAAAARLTHCRRRARRRRSSEPGGLPGGLSRRGSDGCYPAAAGRPDGPGVLRELRRREVSRTRRRALGLRGDRGSARVNVHQRKDRDHEQHFRDVPDVPITSFELMLPEGPFSALAANGNLCKKAMVMPTEFIAQNGAELHQSTKIQVTGCPKTKRVSHEKSKQRKGKKAGAKGRKKG